MPEAADLQWAGLSLVRLLGKGGVDLPDKLLRFLQAETANPHLTLELINSLRNCGVLVTIGERQRATSGRAAKAANLEKARAVKTKLRRTRKNG